MGAFELAEHLPGGFDAGGGVEQGLRAVFVVEGVEGLHEGGLFGFVAPCEQVELALRGGDKAKEHDATFAIAVALAEDTAGRS